MVVGLRKGAIETPGAEADADIEDRPGLEAVMAQGLQSEPPGQAAVALGQVGLERPQRIFDTRNNGAADGRGLCFDGGHRCHVRSAGAGRL